MHEIERIKALRNSIAVARQVPVAAFTGSCPTKRSTGRAKKRRAGEL
jgi:hypothetical protein